MKKGFIPVAWLMRYPLFFGELIMFRMKDKQPGNYETIYRYILSEILSTCGIRS